MSQTMIEITINGKKHTVPADANILDACEMSGYKIPTMCRDRERSAPFTSCFLCIVQVEGAPRFSPSCGTSVKIKEGLKVTVSGDPVDVARKMGLELMLSDHNADCKPPCHKGCPAHADVQGYVNAIANGQYRTAVEVLMKRIPLPSTLGRICPHPCEDECRRNYVDKPVSIRNLKRFVSDHVIENGPYLPPVKPDTGKKVAVIGGGPAGLTAAFYLRQNGHKVTIYEQMPALGGMLRYGIPEYRLPKAMLDKEIAIITGLGIDVHLNKRLGKDIKLDDLEKKYDAVFLGLGAWKSKGLRVKGEDHPQVLGGIEFLREVVMGKPPKLGKKTIVIGGGNTAIDAARTALRLGSESYLVYRRTRDEMPAEKEEIHDAEEEGVHLMFLIGPVGLKFEGEKLVGLECVKMCLGEPDASGRRSPVPVECSEYCLEADTIIKAIGQDVEPGLMDGTGINVSKYNTAEVEKPSFRTNHRKVFAGGDFVTGPALVVDALYSGRKAAEAIDAMLSGRTIPATKDIVSTRDHVDDEYFADEPKKPREEPKLLAPGKRKKNFMEVDTGLTESQALEEAARCMACGCQDLNDCKLREYMNEYQADPRRFSGDNHEYPMDSSHPNLLLEPNKCVKCGRCVEVCESARGISVFGFVNRGFNSMISPSLRLPLAETDCIACGDCAAVCPVGAITEKIPLRRPGPFETKIIATTCARCSLGCQVNLHTVGDILYKITPSETGWNGIHMCHLGRFDYADANSPARLKVPLALKNKKLCETTWQEALETAAENLKKKPSIILSPFCTNEEAYLARQLAKSLGGEALLLDENHESAMIVARALEASKTGITLDALKDMEILMLYDTNIIGSFSVAGVKIRQAAAESTQVIVAGDKPHRIRKARVAGASGKAFLDGLLAVLLKDYGQLLTSEKERKIDGAGNKLLDSLRTLPKDKISSMTGLAYSDLSEIAGMLVSKKSALVFGPTASEDALRLTILSSITGTKLLPLTDGSNVWGIYRLGMKCITTKEFSKLEAASILFLGEPPKGLKKPKACKFLALQSVMSPFNGANLVFPRSIYEENEGTFLATDGTLRKMARGLQTGKQNWKMLVELAEKMSISMQFNKVDDITNALLPEL